MIPVLILFSSGAAQAASTYGERQDWTASYDGRTARIGANFIHCNMASRWHLNGSDLTVLTDGRCSLGWDTGNDWDISGYWTGTKPDGASCTASFSTDETDLGASFAFETAVVGVPVCVFDKVCLSAKHDGGLFGDDTQDFGCQIVNVGGPTAENSTASCTGNEVSAPMVNMTPVKRQVGSSNQWMWTLPGTASLVLGSTAPPSDGTGGVGWRAYVVTTHPTRAFAGADTTSFNYLNSGGVLPRLGVGYSALKPHAAGPMTLDPFGPASQNTSSSGGLDNPANTWLQPAGYSVVGAGIYWSSSTTHAQISTSDVNNGRVGITDPSKCAFYWGAKIAVKPGGDTDEPIGPLPTGAPTGSPTDPVTEPLVPPAADPEAGCSGFSLTDPGSWGGAAMCAVAGLLSTALGVLGNILGAITGLVGALLDGIEALFIPSAGFWDDAFAGLSSDWQDTALGDWTGLLGSLAPDDSLAGCAGPEFTLNLYKFNETVSPFGACSGAGATAAGVIKPLLTAGLVIWGVLGCVRALGSGFGWNMSAGRSGGDD